MRIGGTNRVEALLSNPAAAAAVGGEGVGRTGVDAEQVADRVVVLLPRQPLDQARAGILDRLECGQRRFDRLGRRLPFTLARRGLVLGRHRLLGEASSTICARSRSLASDPRPSVPTTLIPAFGFRSPWQLRQNFSRTGLAAFERGRIAALGRTAVAARIARQTAIDRRRGIAASRGAGKAFEAAVTSAGAARAG